MFRARLQIARPLRRRRPSRWAQIGSFRQPAMINMSCKIAAPRAPGAHSRPAASRSRARHQTQKFRRQRRELRLRHIALRVYDYVPSCSYLQTMAAHDFPHTPPDAVAHHRAAKCLLDAESKPAVRQFIRAKKNGEVGIRAALSGAVYGVKLSAPHQPRLARKA